MQMCVLLLILIFNNIWMMHVCCQQIEPITVVLVKPCDVYMRDNVLQNYVHTMS